MMRFVVAALLMLGVTFSVQARNTEYHPKISDGADYKDKICTDVALYFGDQPTRAVA
jgi:hypothetical protein